MVLPEPPARAVPAVEEEPPAGIAGNAPVPVEALVEVVPVLFAAPPASKLPLAPPATVSPVPPVLPGAPAVDEVPPATLVLLLGAPELPVEPVPGAPALGDTPPVA